MRRSTKCPPNCSAALPSSTPHSGIGPSLLWTRRCLRRLGMSSWWAPWGLPRRALSAVLCAQPRRGGRRKFWLAVCLVYLCCCWGGRHTLPSPSSCLATPHISNRPPLGAVSKQLQQLYVATWRNKARAARAAFPFPAFFFCPPPPGGMHPRPTARPRSLLRSCQSPTLFWHRARWLVPLQPHQTRARPRFSVRPANSVATSHSTARGTTSLR